MVMICNTDKSSTRERSYVEELLKRKVDGIIYNTYKRNKENIEYFTKLSKQNARCLHGPYAGRRYNVPYVLTEDLTSSKKAAKYLISKGKCESVT